MKKDKVTIQVKKNYLISRRECKTLKSLVLAQNKTAKNSRVIFDFLEVKFISRSFADEFLNLLTDLDFQGIKIRLAHVSPKIKPLFALVKKRRDRIKKELG
ncbi:MAG: hypothetical protein ABH896_02490 [Candidatus Jacksonbacteria bacterium]